MGTKSLAAWQNVALAVLLAASLLVAAGTPHPLRLAAVGRVYLPIVLKQYHPPLWIVLDSPEVEHGLFLDSGGDWDTTLVLAGNPRVWARRTGNGQALPSADGNATPDYYMQLRVDDGVFFAGVPTTRVVAEIEYLDQGTDSFALQYDALRGGPFTDGRFKDAGRVTKSNSERFRVAAFRLCDAYFANRDNGGDLRISDNGDGAETIRSVTISLLPPDSQVIHVDSCGANPRDDLPDSDAIQACVDRACDGDVVIFTSGVNTPGYRGYTVDKSIFLIANSAKQNLVFTSSDPANHALLRAHASLKGFVVKLYARSRLTNAGDIDNITLSHLSLDGGRSVRRCFGPDGSEDGIGDNWGSWLPECSSAGDAWCRAGTVALEGPFAADYLAYPSDSTTGLLVEDVTISNTECGTALFLSGAASTIRNSTIDLAGDHVHAPGCAQTDADEGIGGWSDGITFFGPSNVISGNVILDPSDVGIVFFGGKDTVIQNNTVRVRAGNHGAFAGIAIHPWGLGDVSGVRVVGNQVINEGSSSCGGIHAGIDIGTHMWGAGCVNNPTPEAVGNPNLCVAEPPQPLGTFCGSAPLCQEWAHVAAGRTFTLQGNYVSGCQINYLIEGLDLVGTLVESGNTSGPPRDTDWQSSNGCGAEGDTWGAIDRVAHHPSLPGWVDRRVHCER